MSAIKIKPLKPTVSRVVALSVIADFLEFVKRSDDVELALWDELAGDFNCLSEENVDFLYDAYTENLEQRGFPE